MFHNTTKETGATHYAMALQSRSQEHKVITYFQNHPNEGFTWDDVSKVFPSMNEVSLKRSLSDLKNEGKLIKTSEKGISKYGRPAYKYALKTEYMVKITGKRPCEEGFIMTMQFQFSENTPVVDEQTFANESAAKAYYYRLRRDVFTNNLERFVLRAKSTPGPKTDEVEKAIDRGLKAVEYFVSNDVTLNKMCEMTLKIENLLVSLLPSPKKERYDTELRYLNDIIRFCKEEIERTKKEA